MTKRNKTIIILSSILSGLILVSGAAVMTNGFTDFNPDNFVANLEEDSFQVEEVNNIRFSQVKENLLEDGTIQKQVKFTLEPSTADYNNLNAAILWNTTYNESFENEDWHKDKNVLEYVDYQLDGDTKTLTFNCYQPFGTEIIFTLSSKDDPNVNATLKINYNRREIQKATANISFDGFTPNESMKIDTTLPVYSIGSKGDRAPTSGFDCFTNFIKAEDYDWDDYFSGVSTVGIYSSNFKYQGQSYTDTTLLMKEMKSKVFNYLSTIVNIDVDNMFDLSKLKDLLTYEFVAMHTYEDVYAESAINFSYFVNKYHEAYAKGGGIQVTVTFEDEEIAKKRLQLNVSADTITNIAMEQTEIEF